MLCFPDEMSSNVPGPWLGRERIGVTHPSGVALCGPVVR